MSPADAHRRASNGDIGGPDRQDQPMSASRDDQRITVALVNDYELVIKGLHAMLTPYSDRIVVTDYDIGDDRPGTGGSGNGESSNGSIDGPVDIALFDTFAARRDALQRAQAMMDDDNVQHVVLYTWDAPPEFVEQARSIGVDGVIPKTTTADELVRSLEKVAAGQSVGLDDPVKGERSRVDGPELTVREQEVLALLALGLSNAEIAHELFLSVDTIKTHVRRVFNKLGVNNRTQAAMRVVTAQSGLHRPITRTSPG
jgi:two-component system, NarL family, response regulator LiaR